MLKLIPPGKRKGNRFYIIRGRFEGVAVEKTTETADKAVAARIRNEIERRILDGAVPGPNARVSFHRACDLYLAAKGHLGPQDVKAVLRLKEAIADKPVQDIVQADLDQAANLLYPRHAPESRDRLAYSPAAAVLHYAHENRWRDWMRVKRPKKKQAETRAASDSTIPVLLNATSGKRRLLVMWLFKHGTRISGALSVDCARIHLDTMEYEIYVSKSRVWRTFPIDDEVGAMLREDPDVIAGHGPLFPWRNRSSVYEWLIPLVRKLKVTFTPHMARHWLGKKLRRHGLRTIMDALGQTNPNSAFRYVSSDIEAVRDATKSVGKILGRTALKR
jgi:integrase